MNLTDYFNQSQLSPSVSHFIWLIPLFMLWSLFWKGFALWRAGRNNQPGWFIALLLLNTIGLLPILYLVLFQPKPKKSH